MIRLAIVEDHPALADGLATLIPGSSDVNVVGTAPDVATAAALIERETPDVVLCDVRLAHDDDGFDLVREFSPRPAFIMLTAVSYPSYHARAVDLGAMGYLSKMASVDQILDAIRAVAAGGTAYPSDARRSAKEALRLPTPRELEILGLVAEGLSNVEIADAHVTPGEDRRKPVAPPLRSLRRHQSDCPGTRRRPPGLDRRDPIGSPRNSRVFILAGDRALTYVRHAKLEGLTIHPAPPGSVSSSVSQPLATGRSRSDGEGFTLSGGPRGVV